MAEEAVDTIEGGGVGEAKSASLHEELLAVTETLQLWSIEGPPRNPRASAGVLLEQIKGAAPAVAALVADASEWRKRVVQLEEQTRKLRQEADDSCRHAEELEVQLEEAGAAERQREAEAREVLEAARATEAELRGRLAEEEAKGQAQEAEINRLRAQNMALCAQVREGMPPVTVMCRVRPMESYGSQDPAILKSALSIDLNEISVEDGSSRARKFRVGRVLDGGVTQDDVFSAVAPLVETVTTGGSACIFAYGATGSGKTFTLQGGEKYGAAPGLTYHALRCLLEGPSGGPVRLSMVEVYCEQIRDLGKDNASDANAQPTNLQCPRRDTQGRMVLDCARCDVSSFAEAEEFLLKGYGARAAGGTLCNDRSSRSHVVLFATCIRMNDNESVAGGQLILVDLAGSENVQRSGADEDSKLLAEAKAINKSLSALADVVEATAKRQQFVPYRNSKLTMLLEEALTSAKVLMMVHISPLSRDATDTGHSLNFAGRVQAVDFGAQRMRAEQEERLKSSLQRLRKEKDAAEGREAELRKQNALLTEQLHARSKEPTAERSAPPAKLDEGNGTPHRRRPVATEQRGPTGRASPELRHVFGRVPTPDPRKHDPPARQRQPTPRPSRQVVDALMGQDACNESEELKAAHRRGGRGAEVGEEQGDAPVAGGADKADAGCEEGKARILADITNLCSGGAGEKEGKELPQGKSQLHQRACSDTTICHTPERCVSALLPQSEDGAEADTVWIDQELLGAREGGAAEGEPATWLKSILKREKTNFALKMKQRRVHLSEEGGIASTPTGTRRVRFDDEGVDAKSPPRWYLAVMEYERQEARAREEETGVSPAGRSHRSSRRQRELKTSDSQESVGGRWR